MPHRGQAILYPACVELTFPFSRDLIDALKATIPASSRSYNPETKTWTVRLPHDRQAVYLLKSFYPEAIIIEAHDPPPDFTRPRQPLAEERHYAALALLPSAPPPVVRAAYLAWVKLSHPDTLPPGERDAAHLRMCQINVAYEALRAEGAA